MILQVTHPRYRHSHRHSLVKLFHKVLTFQHISQWASLCHSIPNQTRAFRGGEETTAAPSGVGEEGETTGTLPRQDRGHA